MNRKQFDRYLWALKSVCGDNTEILRNRILLEILKDLKVKKYVEPKERIQFI